MPDHKADARAAFLGLLIGAISLFVVAFGIVQMTNAKYSGRAPAASQH